jgi:DNA polymerase III alpha subunit (gram-positive type)
MGKQNVNYVVLDFETGGLKPDAHGITEIACCAMDSELNDLAEFNRLVKPHEAFLYDQKALDMSIKMTLAELKEKGEESEVVFNDFLKYISALKVGANKPIMSGHNFDKFDSGFLAKWFELFKVDITKYVNTDFTIDTMHWARLKWLDSPNYKLGTCCQVAGIDLTDAHKALADTRANKELVKKFILSLRGEGINSNQKKFRNNFKF